MATTTTTSAVCVQVRLHPSLIVSNDEETARCGECGVMPVLRLPCCGLLLCEWCGLNQVLAHRGSIWCGRCGVVVVGCGQRWAVY